MTYKIIVHGDAKEGFWAEVPALPGCVSQGDTMKQLQANIREAIEGHLEDLATNEDAPKNGIKKRKTTPLA